MTTSESLQDDVSYSVSDFLRLCPADPEVKELVILRLITVRQNDNPDISPSDITATGAELQFLLTHIEKLVAQFRTFPVTINVPGMPPLNFADPLPLLFTELFDLMSRYSIAGLPPISRFRNNGAR